MVYRGHVENGMIQLEEAVVLPEGAEVRVEVAAGKDEFDPDALPIEDKLRPIVRGCSQGGVGPVAGGPDRPPGPLHLRDAKVMYKVFAAR